MGARERTCSCPPFVLAVVAAMNSSEQHPNPPFRLKWYHIILLQPIVALEALGIFLLLNLVILGEPPWDWDTIPLFRLYSFFCIASYVASAIICLPLFYFLKSWKWRLAILLIVIPFFVVVLFSTFVLLFVHSP